MTGSFRNIISGFAIAALLVVGGCTPKEDIVFKGIKTITADTRDDVPILTGEAFFYNPNSVRMKLKEIHVDILVDGKPSATVRQDLNLLIPAKSDFSVTILAELSLKDVGLLDTVINILGGKKYQVEYVGYLRVALHGITFKVPVKYKEEVRIKI